MGTPSESGLKPRIRATILRAFQLKESPLAELKMGDLPEWDSLGHMNLVVEIEKEFGVRFPNFMISEITSESAIAGSIERLLAEKN